MRRVNIHGKSCERLLTNFTISLLFFGLHETMLKIPHFFEFILLQFDGKWQNRRIKYALYKNCTFKILHYFIKKTTCTCFYFHRHLPFKETSWPPCRTILPLGKYFSLFDRDLLTFRKKFIVLYVLDFQNEQINCTKGNQKHIS